jgi:DeoR family fructose operon transcriptional repressor
MNKIKQREKQVLELLQNFQRLEIKNIAQWLKISETTARRMCKKLEEEQKVIRVHGGIKLSNQPPYSYSFQSKLTNNLHEKVAIGQFAAQLIESGDRIFCDSGTTIHQFVLSLIARIKKKELHDIVLLTNSLANYNPIANYCKVILVGGEVRLSRMDMCGTIAETTLKKFHLTKAILGADAVSLEKGFMTTDERTAKINEIIINNAEKSYILVDASKFNKNSFIAFANARDVSEVITSCPLDSSTIDKFKKEGYQIKLIDTPKF